MRCLYLSWNVSLMQAKFATKWKMNKNGLDVPPHFGIIALSSLDRSKAEAALRSPKTSVTVIVK